MNDSEKRAYLAEFTDETVEKMTAEVLRAEAEKLLPDYSFRETVARVNLTDDVAGFGGAMAAVDNMLTTLKGAYRDRDPKRTFQYGEVQLTVRNDDYSLRSSLKYAAQRARKAIAEEAEAAAKEAEAQGETVPAGWDKV